MPFQKAKCTNCGGPLEVDRAAGTARCPHCGTAYLYDRETNRYYTTNHISAEVVHVHGEDRRDFQIRAGRLEKYNGMSAVVEIPSEVTIIGEDAFRGCTALEQVEIPQGVKVIGCGAFAQCSSLGRVSLPEGLVKIGDNAFASCRSLTSLRIPQSVRRIGRTAFQHCSALSAVTIRGEPRLDIDSDFSSAGLHDRYVFDDCESLHSIDAPETWKQENAAHARCLFQPMEGSRKRGCYIATAIYGGYDCPQVRVLRRWRDETLCRGLIGRAFVRIYYALSPALVRRWGRSGPFQRFWRWILDRLVRALNHRGVSDAPYTDPEP